MINIIRGEDKTAVITLQGLDLSTATAIAVQFPSLSTVILKTLASGDVVIADAAAGRIEVTLNDSETQHLPCGQELAFEIVVDFGANRRIFQSSTLNVAPKIF